MTRGRNGSNAVSGASARSGAAGTADDARRRQPGGAGDRAHEIGIGERRRPGDHQGARPVPVDRQRRQDRARHVVLVDRLHQRPPAAGQRHDRQAAQQRGEALHVVLAGAP